ncbi:CYTH and CHAD domain-containing protein [Aquabacterium sp.]|uniref:CYTH and CHAD domain-containing protein n=1 Tax=Aquabacterium sp. TaxID=1872578 RepID=UPI002B73FC04|nr:CYTH and CHAD domain-containing protein [Aquabacterium sp.]HSW08119.1 CYTH and CHAD domain-containing protein [Aquabacterium sp.]
MFELELKFQIPAERRQALQRAVNTPAASTQRLQARYFDTPDRRLAAAALALRMRKEGPRWVQTLKGAGDGHLKRLEHEVPVAGARGGVPVLDIQRHAGTPVGKQLLAALDDAAPALALVYQTDIRRTTRLLRSGGALIELALDIGEIRAGDARLPVCELELELKRGDVAALTSLASRWAARHGLWLDVRSKSERGDLLARGEPANPPVLARTPPLHGRLAPDAALRCMVGSCLAHALPNAAAVAGDSGGPEHLHQLRVALRRLRSALRLFGDWSPATEAGWSPALATLFSRLGAARDRDMLTASVWPELMRAGAPALHAPSAPPEADADPLPGETCREPACTALMLDLMRFAHGEAPAQPTDTAAEASASAAADAPRLATLARQRLKRLHRQLQRDARAFATADDAARHRTRKRLKRLRYGVELSAGLSRAKAVKRYLACLRPAQDVLGRYNDLCVADALFRAQLPQDAQAWFAVGWIAARREQLLGKAVQAVERLADLPRVP